MNFSMAGWPFRVGRIPLESGNLFLQWQDLCSGVRSESLTCGLDLHLRWGTLSSMVFYTFCVCWIFHHYSLACWSIVPLASHLPSFCWKSKIFTSHTGANSLHVEIDMHNYAIQPSVL